MKKIKLNPTKLNFEIKTISELNLKHIIGGKEKDGGVKTRSNDGNCDVDDDIDDGDLEPKDILTDPILTAPKAEKS